MNICTDYKVIAGLFICLVAPGVVESAQESVLVQYQDSLALKKNVLAAGIDEGDSDSGSDSDEKEKYESPLSKVDYKKHVIRKWREFYGESNREDSSGCDREQEQVLAKSVAWHKDVEDNKGCSKKWRAEHEERAIKQMLMRRAVNRNGRSIGSIFLAGINYTLDGIFGGLDDNAVEEASYAGADIYNLQANDYEVLNQAHDYEQELSRNYVSGLEEKDGLVEAEKGGDVQKSKSGPLLSLSVITSAFLWVLDNVLNVS